MRQPGTPSRPNIAINVSSAQAQPLLISSSSNSITAIQRQLCLSVLSPVSMVATFAGENKARLIRLPKNSRRLRRPVQYKLPEFFSRTRNATRYCTRCVCAYLIQIINETLKPSEFLRQLVGAATFFPTIILFIFYSIFKPFFLHHCHKIEFSLASLKNIYKLYFNF